MRSMKRIACVLLSVVLVICSSGTCFAEVDENGFEHLSNGHIMYNGIEYHPLDHDQVNKTIYAIFSKIPLIGKFSVEAYKNAGIMSGDFVEGNDGTLYIKSSYLKNEGDNIVFSDEYVDSVYNSALDQIKEYDGYSLYPTFKVDSIPRSYFYNDSSYNDYLNFCSSISSGSYVGTLRYPGTSITSASLAASFTDILSVYALVGNSSSPKFCDSYNNYLGYYLSLNFYNKDGSVSYPTQFSNYVCKFSGGSFPVNGNPGYEEYFFNDSIKATYKTSSGNVDAIKFTFSSDGRPLKVYTSRSALLQTFENHGVQNFYTSETFNNYKTENDNSVTINKTVYENTDYETINNNEYNTINNTVNNYYDTNNEIIDTSNIENLIKDFQEQQAQRDEELLNKEQEIVDKTEESIEISKETNNKLDQIYEILLQLYDKISPNGSSSGDGSEFDMNTLIDMLNNLQLSLDTYGQYDLAQIRDNTRDIVNALKSSNPDSESILQDIYTTQLEILELQKNAVEMNKTFFQSVLDYLKKIYDAIVLDGIIDNVKDFLSLDDELSVGAYIEDIMVETSELNEMVKVKFPTSIPWDVLALVRLLACEPQTPHFEIPVHLDLLGNKVEYEIVLDLEQFERVAIFGRGFLSILFSIWLLLITKRILYKDGE